MSHTTADILAGTRSRSTDAERTVLALEAIADQLQMLVAALNPVGEHAKERDLGASDGDARAAGRWENEGGSLILDKMAALGITQRTTDQFEIRGYRYSKLEDAIAEARAVFDRSESLRDSHRA